ncbi:MAG: DUF2809 domain-containing protein [Cyclobacteriaceae bacterium]|nr:DUF2809 domain-containing protein [Cyclobacteriaceae bacterium]
MLTFTKNYFALAIFIFVIEVLIALFVKDNFVRPYVGDVLVVILMYSFVKSFLRVPVLLLAMSVLVFSFLIEALQYIKIVERLGLEKSHFARTVIGTSFAWADILAYMLGIAIILGVETYLLRKSIK